MTGVEPASDVNASAPAGGLDPLEVVVRSIGSHARATNLARADNLALAVSGGVDLIAPDGRRRAAGIAHQIAGSAGTFGFPAASRLAAEIERMLLVGELDAGHLEIVGGHVQALLAALKGEPTY